MFVQSPRFACLLVALLMAAAPSPAQSSKSRWPAIFSKLDAMEKREEWKALAPLLEKHLAEAKKSPGSDRPITLSLMLRLARIYRRLGKYDIAMPLAERVLSVRQKAKAKDPLGVASALEELAMLERERGNFRKALGHARRCLELHEKVQGVEHLDVAGSLGVLAYLYRHLGSFDQAQSCAERCLDICVKKLAPNHPLIAEAYDGLALLYEDQGLYTRAEDAIRKGLAIKEVNFDRDSPRIATSLLILSRPLISLGKNADAEKIIARALTIHEAKLGEKHPQVAITLNNLAAVQVRLGRYTEAEKNYKRSLKIREAILPPRHPLIANSLYHLAWLYERKGALTKAESLNKLALDIRKEKLGEKHLEVASSLERLASIYRLRKEYGKAVKMSERSLAIREARLGGEHPDVHGNLTSLAGLYAASGEAAKAGKLYDRANRGVSRHMLYILPSLSERDQATYMAKGHGNVLHMALSLSRSFSKDRRLSDLSADWLINGKAIAHEALAGSSLLIRDGADPALTGDIKQLEQLRRDLARITYSTPAEGKEKEHRAALAKLSASEQELARKIREHGGSAQQDWVELSEVRKALPRGAVLIDFLRLAVWNHETNRRGDNRYVAWITPEEGPSQVIDLGPAKIIDTRVSALRKELEGASKRILAKGEAEAEKALRPTLDDVAKLILRPVLARIGTSKRVILSPDASLWLVPWEALTLANKRYAVEEYQFSYVVSGRDLVRIRDTKIKQGAPLVLADPDYDLGAVKGAKPVSSRLPRVERLPGTAVEADAIAPRLYRWTEVKPRVYQREKALEAMVKAARNPRALVLCTHGFFLPDQDLRNDEDRPGEKRKAWKNPLLRSGLLLAGCNTGGGDRTKDDGILTALEVVGLDLRGTELVVLSACETGKGEVRNGEGVAGLRQAFLLAGAHAVVSTLWQVDDEGAALLMARFFDNLARKQGKTKALRQAQLRTIQVHREKTTAAHPFFWAAYTLTGR